MHPKIIALAAAGLVLAACGSTTEDRAISGAGIGAAAGAAVGAVTGLSVVQGVVLGAVAGGATGALTDDKQIDLGTPLWRRDSSASKPAAGSSGSGAAPVRDIQTALNARGYDAGPADGIIGPRTRAAIRAYQQDNGLLVDGQPTAALWQHMQRRADGG